MPRHWVTKVFNFLQGLCVIKWHTFLHSCHFMLADFLVPAHLSLYFQCSFQTFSKCYDSICPVKLGSIEITVTAIATKSRKDNFFNYYYSFCSFQIKFCWEVTSRNYRCPQYWECLVALWILRLFWNDSVTPAAHHLLSAISTMKDSFSPQPWFGGQNYLRLTVKKETITKILSDQALGIAG